ncbi:cell division ATP-binding protein FtsE [Candidatus Nomurabacteria bacterium CG10_big_fil_rev_8_21_14_0_10_35_16]|uniref:Cell division ATP-binding protein FtsE n=1 Tax=Candidatus Nomurabacteria bacterium CG10_big_fil_rev_8_21_14_0_10_35_16 TaxID=1974731 RepID=A0A2H0TBP7_9BACT|nr:MAG: cell division ATP-binding protein FtsE [Candidatus Nomurabacteria bacterium CG10_big_fil_rev_8_21_14_0_10_35_16]
MITFQNISKVYKDSSVALENINFTIQPNEFVSIVGRNGAGKSTIIKLLIGEEKPSKGRVIFGPYEVNKLSSVELPALRRQIGIVFQDFRLLPTKTSYENIAFALEVEGRPQSEIDEFVPQVLDMVGLAHRAHNFPNELSGGERQRIAIARAMIHRPAVVVADEPTGNLDPINSVEIMNLLMKINELGTTVILVTHSKEIVNHVNRRVISLDGGRIIRDEENGKYVLA